MEHCPLDSVRLTIGVNPGSMRRTIWTFVRYQFMSPKPVSTTLERKSRALVETGCPPQA